MVDAYRSRSLSLVASHSEPISPIFRLESSQDRQRLSRSVIPTSAGYCGTRPALRQSEVLSPPFNYRMAPRSRRHGLSLPLASHQIGSWLGIIYSVAIFLAMMNATLLELIVFLAIVLVCLISFLMVVLIDPRLYRERAPADASRYCNLCELGMDGNTKHCRICNKCVYRFDHHCLYLNTCIGGRNYHSFFILVTSSTALLAMFLVIAIIRIVQGAGDQRNQEFAMDRWFGSTTAYLITLGALSAPPFFMFIALLSLLAFHVYLGIISMSTYNWIVGNRTPGIEMQSPGSPPKQPEELQARRNEIYDQWLRQNLKHPAQDKVPIESMGESPPLHGAVSAEDVAVSIPTGNELLSPTASDSILNQVEDVLGIEIQVSEGQPSFPRTQPASPIASDSEQIQERIRSSTHCRNDAPADGDVSSVQAADDIISEQDR